MTAASAKKSIVVLVSGNGSNLQAIIEHVNAGKINANISAVIANVPDAYALQRAKNAGIVSELIEHKSFNSQQAYEAQLIASLNKYQPDLIVLAGYMRILSADFVTHFNAKILNIHPSLLPKYKGLDTHNRAIAAGDTEHGASVHFVTAELDGGPVILQSKVPIFAEQDATELEQRVQQQERQMYPLVIKWFCQDRLTMRDNKAVLDDNVLDEKGYAFG